MRRSLALLVAGTFFMENLDGTVITTALPRMAVSLHEPAVRLSVAITAYLVTLAVLIPVSGWIADRFGARTVFAGAIIIFTLASVLCALSTTLAELVVARVLQGAGGALMVPVGRLVVLRETPKSELVRAVAYLTWPALLAPVIAPAVGGVLVTDASWRWIFLINVPLGVIALVAALRLVPRLRSTERRPLDLTGVVLSGVGIALLIDSAQSLEGAHVQGAVVAITALIGIALTAAAVRHLRRTDEPLVDLRTGRIATYRVAILGGSLFALSVGAVPFLVSLDLQDGLHWSALHAGLIVIAIFAGNVAIKPFTTPILRRWPFRSVLAAAALGVGLTMFVCATFGGWTPVALMLVVLFASGVTRSIGFTAYNTIVFSDVPEAQMRDANVLFSTVQTMAIGLGVAVGALAIRAGGPLDRLLGGSGAGVTPYALAFVLVGLVPLVAIAESIRLPRDAGASLAVRRGAE
jgi:EmrB/QacA subfamily drug resistance transporter